jgi:sigma-B regulation protein RsbU (phosphoserine phosphatase)
MTAAPDWLRGGQDDPVRGLESIALFRGADTSEILAAVRQCEVLALEAGATLLLPGQANDTIYVLLGGELAAYLDPAMLADSAIAITPGESVGEMSVVDGQPVSALVVARTQARVLALPGDVFRGRVISIPGVARNLIALLSGRMRRTNEAMLEAQSKRLALEHLRQELRIARQLQSSMIPLPGRLFPDRADIEIAGMMEPASEIGGDFFDAFFLDERTLFLCVGDVSGHGIPAALFMARTVGLLRIAAMGTRRPEVLLERVNEQLCIGNESNIFVTVFCGFLDVPSGQFVHSNAGHCAPLLIDDGAAAPLAIAKGAFVGIVPGLRYAAIESHLDEGATLVCYTDGITEAESTAGSPFSDERLGMFGVANAGKPVEGLLQAVRRELIAFVGDAAPDDDCTLLAVRRPARTRGSSGP